MLRCVVSFLLLSLIACGGTEPPGPPATITDLSGPSLTGTVGQALASPLRVRVADANDRGVPGVAVDFTVASGGGSISQVPASSASSAAQLSVAVTVVDSTDENGEAQARWTLGTIAGEHGAAVTVPGLAALNIMATATPGEPTELTFASSSAFIGIAGQPADGAIIARVEDEFGNPISGIAVNWATVAGGGSVGVASSETNASGNAETTVNLGPGHGLHLFTASAAGLGTDTIGVIAVDGITDPVGDVGAGPAGTTLPDVTFIGQTLLLPDSILVVYLRFANGVSPTPSTGSPASNSVVPWLEFDLDQDSTTGLWPLRRCPPIELDSLGFGVDLFVFGDPRATAVEVPEAPAGSFLYYVVQSLETADRCGSFFGLERITVPIFRSNTLTFGLDFRGPLDDGLFDMTSLAAFPQAGGPTLITDLIPDSLPATFDVRSSGAALARIRSLVERTQLPSAPSARPRPVLLDSEHLRRVFRVTGRE